MKYHEVEHCSAKTLLSGLFSFQSDQHFSQLPGKYLFTGTGRAAMYHVLQYLKKIKHHDDKNSLVLVPQWLCLSFSQLMRKHCSPTLINSEKIKTVLFYHQYGFPQNMGEICDYCDRKKIVLVEDCANLMEGYYKKNPLGGFGLASIYSFSKLFPSIWGGALVTKNEELYQDALANSNKEHSKFISFCLHITKYFAQKRKNQNSIWHMFNEMFYGVAEHAQKMSRVSKNIIAHQLKNKALNQRQLNYQRLLENFHNEPYFQHLETTGVIPFVVPLIAKKSFLMKIKNILDAHGYSTNIYHFDVNRNLFNPNFLECVWIPNHQGLSLNDIDKISGLIRSIQD